MCLIRFFKGLFGKKQTQETPVATAGSYAKSYKVETFIFGKLPTSLAEFQAMPEAKLDNPYRTAAMTMVALCAYAQNKQAGVDMLNYLRGPRPMSPMDIQFMDDRFRGDGKKIPFSYFEGANPGNNYKPTEPMSIQIREQAHSFDTDGYARFDLRSGGADSPRQIVLRKKESSGEWFLWEQQVMVGIKPAKEDDPWA